MATDSGDTLTGNGLGNIIEARDGDDEIHGEAGNDDLRGESGNDTIFGDAGVDTVSGEMVPIHSMEEQIVILY